MKNIIKAVLFTSLLVISGFIIDCGGKDRWDVKTLTDVGAKKVKFKPIKTTIDSLRKIVPNQKVGNTTKRFGTEFYTYEIVCKVREYRMEDDGDYHLVLVDVSDTSKTMIGEIPDPSCPSVAKSGKANTFVKVRTFFKDSVAVKKNVTKQGVYKITGVVFFDKKHRQLGLSPNGIELHPILSIKSVKQ